MSVSKEEIRKVIKQSHSGEVEVLKRFHSLYPNVSLDILQDTTSGDTVLHHAARLGHMEIVRYLMDFFFVDCRNRDNKTALHEACQFGQVEIVQLLLHHKADVNALKKADWTPLMLACTKIQHDRNMAIIKMLTEHGAEINFPNKDGWSVLHMIAREGELDILQYLVQNHLDVTLKTKNGNTALHIAALHGHVALFKYIVSIENHLVFSENNQGNLPLHEAVLSQDVNAFDKIVPYYMENNMASKENKSGFNILHLAAFIGSLDILQNIVENLKLQLSSVTSMEQQNVLHLSARNKYWNVYEYCLKEGVDPSTTDKYGRMPKDYNIYNAESTC